MAIHDQQIYYKPHDHIHEAKFPSIYDQVLHWKPHEQGIEAVDEQKLQDFEKALEGTVGFVNERDVIEGTVIRITDRDAIIDINAKCMLILSLFLK